MVKFILFILIMTETLFADHNSTKLVLGFSEKHNVDITLESAYQDKKFDHGNWGIFYEATNSIFSLGSFLPTLKGFDSHTYQTSLEDNFILKISEINVYPIGYQFYPMDFTLFRTYKFSPYIGATLGIGYVGVSEAQIVDGVEVETNISAGLSLTYNLFVGYRILIVNKSGKGGVGYDLGIMYHKTSATADPDKYLQNKKVVPSTKAYYLAMVVEF